MTRDQSAVWVVVGIVLAVLTAVLLDVLRHELLYRWGREVRS